jgi:hypothetical protein
MQPRIPLAAAMAVLVFAGSAAIAEDTVSTSDKWQPVARTDTQEAFVNVASIKDVAGMPEARVKQNFVQPQPSAKKDKTYLSTRSTYRFDCAGRRVGMKEVRAYPGSDLQGDAVQKMTVSEKNIQWTDAPRDTVFGHMLDFVCGRSSGG